jgi:4-aminobutyrate aminotransferase-like enzyme
MAGRPDSAEAERRALDALERVDGSQIGTVIIEALQGNAGQRATSREFLQALQDFTRRNDAVLVIDETQSAFGRAGSWFAFEGFGLQPDLVIAGKGISSSLPLTALFGRSEVIDAAPPAWCSTCCSPRGCWRTRPRSAPTCSPGCARAFSARASRRRPAGRG